MPVLQLYADEEDIVKLQIKRIMYAEGDHRTQRDKCVEFFKEELVNILQPFMK